MSNSPGNRKRQVRLMASLLEEQDTGLDQWSAEDLRSILEHQLATRLLAELDSLVAPSSRSESAVREIINASGCRTFEDALLGPNISRELLILIKDFAKQALANQESLPAEVARVLYLLSIHRQDPRNSAPVSSLTPQALERERRRCLTLEWLPEKVRAGLRA